MKFADQDSYVLSQLLVTAENNQNDLNVIVQENDYLRGTSVVFQQQGLTANASNPVPVVTLVGQQTIGAALGGIDQPPIRGGGFGCFAGMTMVSLYDGRQLPFIDLYQKRNERLACLSYDDDSRQVPGTILDVARYTTDEMLLVTFSDGSMSSVRPQHRYFTPDGEYVSIEYLLQKKVVHQQGHDVTVANFQYIKAEVFTYNLSIEKWQNYCADGKRVHNLKPLPEF